MSTFPISDLFSIRFWIILGFPFFGLEINFIIFFAIKQHSLSSLPLPVPHLVRNLSSKTVANRRIKRYRFSDELSFSFSTLHFHFVLLRTSAGQQGSYGPMGYAGCCCSKVMKFESLRVGWLSFFHCILAFNKQQRPHSPTRKTNNFLFPALLLLMDDDGRIEICELRAALVASRSTRSIN